MVARLFLGLCHARREHSPVEILLALKSDLAGEQGEQGGMKERDMARLRHRLREDGNGMAGFVPERRGG